MCNCIVHNKTNNKEYVIRPLIKIPKRNDTKSGLLLVIIYVDTYIEWIYDRDLHACI
jgi:hypothetical protein